MRIVRSEDENGAVRLLFIIAQNRPHGPQEEEEVLAIPSDLWQASEERDLDCRFAVCANGITFFGTGHHERAIGIEQCGTMNQKGGSDPMPLKIDMRRTDLHMHGDTAWVECDTVAEDRTRPLYDR